MGNTCKPMAVSFQCMTKFTTNKKKKKNSLPTRQLPPVAVLRIGVSAGRRRGCGQVDCHWRRVHERKWQASSCSIPITAPLELAASSPTIFVGSTRAGCACVCVCVCVSVCEKPFFGQVVLTWVWSLNSNCSLIAFLPTVQNLPHLILWNILI